MSEKWISRSIFFLQVRKKSCLRPHPTVNRTTAPKIVTARKGYETTKIMAHETIVKFTYFWYNLIFLEKLWRKWIIQESSQTPNLNMVNPVLQILMLIKPYTLLHRVKSAFKFLQSIPKSLQYLRVLVEKVVTLGLPIHIIYT